MNNRAAIVERPPRTRSKVANGNRTFVDGDGRSDWARLRRDLIETWVDELGGHERVSTIKLAMIETSAVLYLECHRLAGLVSKGETIDVEKYANISAKLALQLTRIGLDKIEKRRPWQEEVLAANGVRAR